MFTPVSMQLSQAVLCSQKLFNLNRICFNSHAIGFLNLSALSSSPILLTSSFFLSLFDSFCFSLSLRYPLSLCYLPISFLSPSLYLLIPRSPAPFLHCSRHFRSYLCLLPIAAPHFSILIFGLLHSTPFAL